MGNGGNLVPSTWTTFKNAVRKGWHGWTLPKQIQACSRGDETPASDIISLEAVPCCHMPRACCDSGQEDIKLVSFITQGPYRNIAANDLAFWADAAHHGVSHCSNAWTWTSAMKFSNWKTTLTTQCTLTLSIVQAQAKHAACQVPRHLHPAAQTPLEHPAPARPHPLQPQPPHQQLLQQLLPGPDCRWRRHWQLTS